MRKFLNALAWLAIVLFVLFDIVLVMGTRLPRQHSVVRTVTIHQPAQRIWAALTDFAQQPKWRPDLVSVERMPQRGGQEVWRENYKNGMSDTLITEQWVPPVYLVRTILGEMSRRKGDSVEVSHCGRSCQGPGTQDPVDQEAAGLARSAL